MWQAVTHRAQQVRQALAALGAARADGRAEPMRGRAALSVQGVELLRELEPLFELWAGPLQSGDIEAQVAEVVGRWQGRLAATRLVPHEQAKAELTSALDEVDQQVGWLTAAATDLVHDLEPVLTSQTDSASSSQNAGLSEEILGKINHWHQQVSGSSQQGLPSGSVLGKLADAAGAVVTSWKISDSGSQSLDYSSCRGVLIDAWQTCLASVVEEERQEVLQRKADLQASLHIRRQQWNTQLQNLQTCRQPSLRLQGKERIAPLDLGIDGQPELTPTHFLSRFPSFDFALGLLGTPCMKEEAGPGEASVVPSPVTSPVTSPTGWNHRRLFSFFRKSIPPPCSPSNCPNVIAAAPVAGNSHSTTQPCGSEDKKAAGCADDDVEDEEDVVTICGAKVHSSIPEPRKGERSRLQPRSKSESDMRDMLAGGGAVGASERRRSDDDLAPALASAPCRYVPTRRHASASPEPSGSVVASPGWASRSPTGGLRFGLGEGSLTPPPLPEALTWGPGPPSASPPNLRQAATPLGSPPALRQAATPGRLFLESPLPKGRLCLRAA